MSHRLHLIHGRSASCLATAFLLAIAGSSAAAPTQTAPPQGLRDKTPAVHALVGGRIVSSPGHVIDKGTVVIRDGVITAVGAEVAPPADARTWNMAGKTIYPGLIDAYSELTESETKPTQPPAGATYWNKLVTPERRADRLFVASEKVNKVYRGQGVVARLIVPAGGIIKGGSAVVTTGDDPPVRSVLRSPVALHVRLTVTRGPNRDHYPNSPMGAVALARQAMYDAEWYGRVWAAYQPESTLPRPERNDALAALKRFRAERWPVIFETPNQRYLLRADLFAREFDLPAVMLGSGREYERLDEVKATGRPIIVPVDFPKAPNVASPDRAANVPLRDLMRWDIAPENAARLDKAGVVIALTGHGLKDRSGLLKAVRQAVQRGLPADRALAALTTTPAELLGLTDRMGVVEPSKAAHLVITDGDLFNEETKVLATWVDGRRYEVKPKPVIDPRGRWKVTLRPPGGAPISATVSLSGKSDRLEGAIEVEREGKSDKTELKHLAQADTQVTATFKADAFGHEGTARLSATIASDRWLGVVVWPDGRRTPCAGRRTPAGKTDRAETGENGNKDEPNQEKKEPTLAKDRRALYEVNFPLGAYGRTETPPQPKLVAFANATVWTSGPAGVLKNAHVIVSEGTITAVGVGRAQLPADAVVIDCKGKHLTPGIIDCHSHIATDGGVNESAQAITAEVRIGDFVDGDDIAIYRQLAGGTTCANILHGSANPIGGQNQVIKFRWGATGEAMKFKAAPPGIKFALGENVKQSNWGDKYTKRYPQTRMGVEQIIRDAFQAAREYQAEWDAWDKAGAQAADGAPPDRAPPRVDLELQALAEVLAAKRWVHCHSYRQDEMLALLRTCREFGVTIGVLQHVLEGYKIADAMAADGVMGSAFSDWWAYKFEVYDAIPYAGALMHNAGVVVSFNSDDAELGRRLNVEAAKAVKYGGVPEAEAFKFVTINPARQLRIDGRVGSLEVGKDADLVVWSGPPMSIYTRCEQTWIEGRKYFDREDDLKQRETAARMRAALVQRILASGEPMRAESEGGKNDAELVARINEFCGHCVIKGGGR